MFFVDRQVEPNCGDAYMIGPAEIRFVTAENTYLGFGDNINIESSSTYSGHPIAWLMDGGTEGVGNEFLWHRGAMSNNWLEFTFDQVYEIQKFEMFYRSWVNCNPRNFKITIGGVETEYVAEPTEANQWLSFQLYGPGNFQFLCFSEIYHFSNSIFEKYCSFGKFGKRIRFHVHLNFTNLS